MVSNRWGWNIQRLEIGDDGIGFLLAQHVLECWHAYTALEDELPHMLFPSVDEMFRQGWGELRRRHMAEATIFLIQALLEFLCRLGLLSTISLSTENSEAQRQKRQLSATCRVQ